jgi:site-specific DNA recombinase
LVAAADKKMQNNTPEPVSMPVVKPVWCAIYVRVSTEEQAKEEHYSIPAQEDNCLGEIARRQGEGWVHRRTFIDAGYTGRNIERPGLLELMKMVRRGEIQVVVVYKRERLIRDSALAAQVQSVFDYHGVRVLSHLEGMADASPHSVLMRTFIDAMAQFEHATIRLRVHGCLRFAAKQGDWKGGRPSFGYDYTKGTKRLSINEGEAKIVRVIFEEVAAGVPLHEIAYKLRGLGLYGRLRKVINV